MAGMHRRYDMFITYGLRTTFFFPSLAKHLPYNTNKLCWDFFLAHISQCVLVNDTIKSKNICNALFVCYVYMSFRRHGYHDLFIFSFTIKWSKWCLRDLTAPLYNISRSQRGVVKVNNTTIRHKWFSRFPVDKGMFTYLHYHLDDQ